MTDSNGPEEEPEVKNTSPLAERIESQAKGVRATADLIARSVLSNDPPTWADVIGYLDRWSSNMHGWSAEVRELTAKSEF